MKVERIVILANSYKKGGRWIAGRIVTASSIGHWLRPISNEPEGELQPRHMVTSNGSLPSVLDIIDIPLDHYAEDKCHPEDWVIDASIPWKKQKPFPQKNLGGLEEKPSDLWIESSTRSDRVTRSFLLEQNKYQSLYLIRPIDFHVKLTNDFNPFEGNNQKKRRACFTYRNQHYSLGLTDPVFIDAFAKNFPSPDQPAIVARPPYGDNCLLCVSLTPVFNGYHYKVVATVLERP